MEKSKAKEIKKINLMLAGAYVHQATILRWLHKHRKRNLNWNITVYDGFGDCSWNGGRINRGVNLTAEQLNLWYKNDINIALTFSNPVINTLDIKGNELLIRFHKKGNKIICINRELNEYIHQYYPLYKTIYSITGTGDTDINCTEKDTNWYKNILEEFDEVVPRMEHIFTDGFKTILEEYGPRLEIMINDTCEYGCPYYTEHFKAIAKANTFNNIWSTNNQVAIKIEECWLKGFNPSIGNQKKKEQLKEKYGMDLTPDQIRYLSSFGVSFKIIGRENKGQELEYELDNFLLGVKMDVEPEGLGGQDGIS